MKNKLSDLNDHLFAQLERLADEDLTPEQIEHESKRGEAIVKVADQIVRNAALQLRAAEIAFEGGADPVPYLPAPALDGPTVRRSMLASAFAQSTVEELSERCIPTAAPTREQLEDRVFKAMQFRAGGDEGAVNAKHVLRKIEAEIGKPSTYEGKAEPVTDLHGHKFIDWHYPCLSGWHTHPLHLGAHSNVET